MYVLSRHLGQIGCLTNKTKKMINSNLQMTDFRSQIEQFLSSFFPISQLSIKLDNYSVLDLIIIHHDSIVCT